MTADPDLVSYYSRRAPEYEAIYRRRDPARRAEQRRLAAAMRAALAGRRVLEVACGTGYWTARVAPAVRSLTAVDASEAMLARARRRRWSPGRVAVRAGDAYDLEAVAGRFDGGLAACWLSHVPRARLAEFLDRFHARLAPGAAVFLADNVFVPGEGGELVGAAGGGDTYKLRRLADGSEHRVLKNYFAEGELAALLAPRARAAAIHRGAFFWWVAYRAAPPAVPADAPAGGRAGGGR
jgi:SAM-dependent methyltransferase